MDGRGAAYSRAAAGGAPLVPGTGYNALKLRSWLAKTGGAPTLTGKDPVGLFRDDGWLDIIGSPLTDQAKLTERFRRVNYGRMEIDITVDDPKVYTKPWTVRHLQDIMPDGELIEFICEENNRFPPQ